MKVSLNFFALIFEQMYGRRWRTKIESTFPHGGFPVASQNIHSHFITAKPVKCEAIM